MEPRRLKHANRLVVIDKVKPEALSIAIFSLSMLYVVKRVLQNNLIKFSGHLRLLVLNSQYASIADVSAVSEDAENGIKPATVS
jgi:hypothetical protein